MLVYSLRLVAFAGETLFALEHIFFLFSSTSPRKVNTKSTDRLPGPPNPRLHQVVNHGADLSAAALIKYQLGAPARRCSLFPQLRESEYLSQ